MQLMGYPSELKMPAGTKEYYTVTPAEEQRRRKAFVFGHIWRACILDSINMLIHVPRKRHTMDVEAAPKFEEMAYAKKGELFKWLREEKFNLVR
ncbi:unnamed protein product [Peronospora belbahrii]|uniref:Uncharacterized protein n=1 Tax=Peronospora belbahrii TaxID=622444 RepID=A0ABN8D4N7_9STRA|nr:unnamed protein product [Peronospora belbahrii]